MPDKTNTDKSYWKKSILELNDTKLLEYIRDMCNSRLDIGRADSRFNNDKDPSITESPINVNYNNTPTKLEPIMRMRTPKEEAEDNNEV